MYLCMQMLNVDLNDVLSVMIICAISFTFNTHVSFKIALAVIFDCDHFKMSSFRSLASQGTTVSSINFSQ